MPGHAQSAATRAKISAALKGKKRLSMTAKTNNIQRHARTKLKAGTITRAEYLRRMRTAAKMKPRTSNPVTGDMNSAIKAMLARSEHPVHGASHRRAAGRMR